MSASAPSTEVCACSMLAEDNVRLRQAGCQLAEAALHVAREHDGVHRLMLAVSAWALAVAGEGGRERRHGPADGGEAGGES